MHDLVKTPLILSLPKQGLIFPNSACLTSTDLSGHDNDTETGSEPLTGCPNLSLITWIWEFVHELTPHTFNPCTAENSLTWAVWELDAHTASICITFPAWGDPDQMLWRTSCLLLSTIHFLSFSLSTSQALKNFLQTRNILYSIACGVFCIPHTYSIAQHCLLCACACSTSAGLLIFLSCWVTLMLQSCVEIF